VIAVERDPLLAGDESKAAPEFQQETLQMSNQGNPDYCFFAAGLIRPRIASYT
jgi:hypothetical protein